MESNFKEISEIRLKHILDLITTRHNICLLGPGGTGKSYIIKEIYNRLTEVGKCVAKTSTTGISAINIAGCTLHRWAGCGLLDGDVEQIYDKFLRFNVKTRERWNTTDLLIIDEISMLGRETFEKIDALARKVTRKDLPFGGIKLLVIGDFLQLPPVKDEFVFESELWRTYEFTYIKFIHGFRYDDKDYYNMLMRVRTCENTVEDLKFIKNRNKLYEELIKNNIENKSYTFMYATNKQADFHNKQELDKIQKSEHEYIARDKFIPTSEFKKKTGKLTSAEFETYAKLMDAAIPKKIILKRGALVMLRYNVDVDNGLANGTQAHIRKCIHYNKEDENSGETSRDKVRIRLLENGESAWIESVVFELQIPGKGIFTRTQIPIIVAFAATIHKFQGATLTNAIVDLGKSVFESAQAYVALSRVRNPNNLYISNWDKKSIKVNPLALSFDLEVDKVCTKL